MGGTLDLLAVESTLSTQFPPALSLHHHLIIPWKGALTLLAQTLHYVPDILDGRFPVSFFPPNFQAVHQQDDELSILHANGHHLPIGAIGCTPGRMAQVHLV